MKSRAPGAALVAAALAGLAGLAVLAACGGPGAKAPAPGGDGAAAATAKKAPASAVDAYTITAVGERTIGPFLARHGDGRGGLTVWVTAAEGMGRRVVAVPLSASGQPRGGETTLATVPVDTTSLIVRTMRGSAPGFAVAWTALTDRGEALSVVAVGVDGAARGKPVELARTAEDIVWVDVVPTDAGAVCVWAEETRGADANVVAAALDTDGKMRGVPVRVARGVTGWHAIEVPGGVGVATVSAGAVSSAKPNGGAAGHAPPQTAGSLSFQKLDAEGHGGDHPVIIAPQPTVSGDVEVVRDGKRLLFAWTDRTLDEPFVAAAALGEDGAVAAPRRIVEGRGGAALLGATAGPFGAAIMWEAPVRHAESRNVHIARVGQALSLEGRALTFESVGRATPEIAATSSGVAVLASMRDCDDGSPTCPDAPVVATVLRTDATLGVLQREPLGPVGDPASMAWGLSCAGGETCFSLSASGASPARVRAVAVNPRVNARPPVPAAQLAKDGPRVTDVAAIASGETVVDLAATRIGDVSILAMLSAKPDAPVARGRTEEGAPRTAGLVLSTRVLDANGSAQAPVVLSTRALAVGGVAIASADKPDEGGAVAWVARENGDPEVHVTRIDKKGKRTNDVQLTTTKGDASDVAIAWGGGGWIVAWVDGRDGNGEVYATKVDTGLQRIAREERITSAPGDASDLVALPKGDLVWLAWADPRESPKDGMADIYVGAVKMRDAKRAFDETRVLATAAHSRTPQLAPAPDGVHVAWIEEAPLGSEEPTASGYGAMWATLDAKGKPSGRPVKLPLGGAGAATAIALEVAASGELRGVLARSMADGIALDALELIGGLTGGAGGPRAFPLLTLDGPPSLDVALVLRDGVLFFNDDGPTAADKRARRARIAWISARP